MDDFSAADELANLKEKLQATREKFDVWNNDVINEMKDGFNQFDANIEKHESHLKELQESLDTLRKKNLANQEAAKEGISTLDNAKKYLNSVQECIKVTQAEKVEAEVQLKSVEEKLQNEKEILESTEQALRERTNELSRSALMTKDVLGLSFQKAPGQKMQVVFRQIDPNNPEDPFVLSMKVLAGKYEVSDCEPKIADLDELVQKLNETNNFRSFVITVRSRFVKMV